jgi:hypothetical protein
VARLRPTPDEKRRRKALFQAINRFILDHSGWVTSADSAVNVRFETTNPELPELLLREFGFDAQDSGTAERFLPSPVAFKQNGRTLTRDVLTSQEVKIFTFELP